MKTNTPVHPKLDFIPEWLISLNVEVQKHHVHLFKKYENLGQLWGTPENIGILCAEVGLILDDYYGEEQLKQACEEALKRYVARRSAKTASSILAPPTEIILPEGFKK